MTDIAWHTITVDDLADDHPIRTQVEEVLESWAPNHLTDTGRVRDMTGWIERLDGLDLTDGRRLDLGPELDTPAWRKLERIARTIARDSA